MDMVYEFDPKANPNLGWWLTRFKELIASSRYFVDVAIVNGKIVGFLDYLIVFEPTDSRIHGVGQTFFVDKAYRNRLVASKLWNAALNTLRFRGASVLELICFGDNKKFWEKRRFKFKYNYMTRGI